MKDTNDNAKPPTPVGSTGLVARLRHPQAWCDGHADELNAMREAADRIEELETAIESIKAELASLRERQRLCLTMDEAEKLALIRALQEIRDAIGMVGGDKLSPKDIVEGVRAYVPIQVRRGANDHE